MNFSFATLMNVGNIRKLLFRYINTLLIFLSCIASAQSPDRFPASVCPSSCKCNPVDESQPFTTQEETTASTPARFTPILARCWIPANLDRLPCDSSWSIVHLQILTGQPKPDPLTGSTISLQVERFSHSNITVSAQLFDRCASVTRLAVWERSQFNWIPQYWLRPMIKLERLFIQVPTLKILPDHFFAFLPRLNFVKISKCSQLVHISRTVFEPCPERLHTLWLDGNGLRGKLPSGIFRQCNFRTLHLSENQLDKLDWGGLSGLKQLEILYLQHNRLSGSLEQSFSYRKDMNSTALSSTPMLKKLDLSFNLLTSVEGMSWSGECIRTSETSNTNRGLCYLEELNLGHNQLNSLGLNSFSELPRLRKLILDANPNLFTLEGSANLALVLYAVSQVNNHLQSVLIPISPDPTKQLQPRKNESINVCNPDERWFARAPHHLAMVVRHVNLTSCKPHLLSEVEPGSSELTSTRTMTTETIALMPNQSLTLKTTDTQSKDNYDPILAFLRRTNRFNLLVLCLGLILVGLFIGLLPMAYFLCAPKPNRLKSDRERTAPMLPLLVHPGSDAGFLLNDPTQRTNPNSPNGSLCTPLPKRSGKAGRFDALPPVPPTRVHFAPVRISMMHNSADPIRVQSLIQTSAVPTLTQPTIPMIVDRTRRVHSTSNVYQKTHPSIDSASGHSNHRYDLLTPRDSPASVQLHPLTKKSGIRIPDTVYCPTEDTMVSGSTYSLATLTSLRGRSPARGRGTLVPGINQPVG